MPDNVKDIAPKDPSSPKPGQKPKFTGWAISGTLAAILGVIFFVRLGSYDKAATSRPPDLEEVREDLPMKSIDTSATVQKIDTSYNKDDKAASKNKK